MINQKSTFMKSIFTVLSLIISVSVFAQNGYLLDSVLYHAGTENEDIFFKKEYFAYDFLNREVGYQVINFDLFEGYHNTQLTKKTYNLNNRIAKEYQYSFHSILHRDYNFNYSNLTNTAIQQTANYKNYTYESLGNNTKTTIMLQFANDSSSIDRTELRNEFGNLLTIEWQYRNEIYEYNAANKLTRLASYGTYDTTFVFELGREELYHYNNNGQLIEKKYSYRNWDEDSVKYRRKYNYFYNNEGLLATQIVTQIDTNINPHDRKYIYTYNSKGLLIKEVDSIEHNTTFRPLVISEHTYNESDLLIKTVKTFSRINGNDGKQTHIYYYSTENELDDNGESIKVVAFPNPVIDRFNLYVPTELIDSQATIFNASGKLIKTQMIHNQIETITTNNFPKGIYFIKIQKGELNTTVRIVKL